MFSGTAGSRGLLLLGGDALRFDFVLLFLPQAGACFDSEKEECGLESCYDRKT